MHSYLVGPKPDLCVRVVRALCAGLPESILPAYICNIKYQNLMSWLLSIIYPDSEKTRLDQTIFQSPELLKFKS